MVFVSRPPSLRAVSRRPVSFEARAAPLVLVLPLINSVGRGQSVGKPDREITPACCDSIVVTRCRWNLISQQRGIMANRSAIIPSCSVAIS